MLCHLPGNLNSSNQDSSPTNNEDSVVSYSMHIIGAQQNICICDQAVSTPGLAGMSSYISYPSVKEILISMRHRSEVNK